MSNWEYELDEILTNPPDDNSKPIMVDEFDDEIFEDDEYLDMNGWILSRNSLEDVSADTNDFEVNEIKCVECGKIFDDISEKIYLINGDWFCSECVESNIQKARSED